MMANSIELDKETKEKLLEKSDKWHGAFRTT